MGGPRTSWWKPSASALWCPSRVRQACGLRRTNCGDLQAAPPASPMRKWSVAEGCSSAKAREGEEANCAAEEEAAAKKTRAPPCRSRGQRTASRSAWTPKAKAEEESAKARSRSCAPGCAARSGRRRRAAQWRKPRRPRKTDREERRRTQAKGAA